MIFIPGCLIISQLSQLYTLYFSLLGFLLFTHYVATVQTTGKDVAHTTSKEPKHELAFAISDSCFTDHAYPSNLDSPHGTQSLDIHQLLKISTSLISLRKKLPKQNIGLLHQAENSDMEKRVILLTSSAQSMNNQYWLL